MLTEDWEEFERGGDACVNGKDLVYFLYFKRMIVYFTFVVYSNVQSCFASEGDVHNGFLLVSKRKIFI